MRNFLALMATVLVVLCGVSAVRAEEKKSEHSKVTVKVKPKQEVTVHVNHKEATFDLKDSKQLQKFIGHLENDEVEEIEIEKQPMDFSADLGLWAIVVFIGFVFILRKFAWGPMVEGLQKREHSIRQAVDEAKLAREETERLRAQFKAEMDQAFAKIPAMMEDARRNAEKLAAELRTKATADIQAERERQRREIELAHDQALQDLCNQSAQLATLIAGNVLARTITPDDQERMLSIAMEELKNSGPRFRQDVI